jgi:BlaI family transcriptional regulator, penicillinase repressor
LNRSTHENLTRRERQIMDVIYRRGEASAAEVQEGLPDPPSYSAVRAMLRKLEEKGHVEHFEQGARYIYWPTVARYSAQGSALRRLVRTFFDDSPARMVAALVDMKGDELTEDELERISEVIANARKKGS